MARSESYVTPLHWGRVTYGSTRNDSWGGWQDSDQLSGRWNPGGSRVDDHHDLVECHEDAVSMPGTETGTEMAHTDRTFACTRPTGQCFVNSYTCLALLTSL